MHPNSETMNLLQRTNIALSRIFALTTYYVGTSADKDEVPIEIDFRIEEDQEDPGTYTAILKIIGDGGINLTFQSKECNSPVEAIDSIGEHFDEHGFLGGKLSNAPGMPFFVGPAVENFQWPN